jgi:hypothetical protein
MQIFSQNQYNQSISRYKLLSANAGVGSILTTTIGNYILVSDILEWEFISKANRRIQDIRAGGTGSPGEWYKKAKEEITRELGVELVDDERFIAFLKMDKGLANLLCLAAIPHLSLNENYNSVNVFDNPVIKRLEERGAQPKTDWYTIPGTHFPKWFRNEEGVLKTYAEWKEDWMRKNLPELNFAPPRDAHNNYARGAIKIDKTGRTIPIYKELIQLNLILICEHGHLSDIPLSQYLRWKVDGGTGSPDGADLLLAGQPCCDKPRLKWTENKNRSEGYASIYLECTNCGTGGEGSNRKVNLEGINNFKPICAGHKPWEISLEKGRDGIPFDIGCSDRSGQPTRMQVALVTGNNVYFANTFSSLYIPIDLVKGLPEGMEGALQCCHQRYEKLTNSAKTRNVWADKYIQEDLLDELEIKAHDASAFLSQLKRMFIEGEVELLDALGDLHEQFRRQEYDVLTRHGAQSNGKGLKFEDIELPKVLSRYFTKISKVEELKVTSVQLDFTRVRPNERVLGADGTVVAQTGMNIFSGKPEEISILPAVENFGEGIFFQFSEATLKKWQTDHKPVFERRLQDLLPKGNGFNGSAVRLKIWHIGPVYLLIHTFSHLVLRELEFTCGYPTASLKERLYIGRDMAGVLIYTAEGSEGSMGGLIWQAEGERIRQLLKKALEHSMDCSSDPLCWESEGQGLFNLNLAACFSCGLVAETACEERNLALDRRMLVDEGFGFFRALL